MADRKRFLELGALVMGGALVGASLTVPLPTFSEGEVNFSPSPTVIPDSTQKAGLGFIQDLVDCDNGPLTVSRTVEVENGERVRLDNFVTLSFPSEGKGKISVTPGLEGAYPEVVNGGVIYENSTVIIGARPEVSSSNKTNLIVNVSCLS